MVFFEIEKTFSKIQLHLQYLYGHLQKKKKTLDY